MSAFKIKTLHAFITTAEDGTEGIITEKAGNLLYPFISAHEARIASLLPIAQKIAEERKWPITLAKFSVREDVCLIGDTKEVKAD